MLKRHMTLQRTSKVTITAALLQPKLHIWPTVLQTGLQRSLL